MERECIDEDEVRKFGRNPYRKVDNARASFPSWAVLFMYTTWERREGVYELIGELCEAFNNIGLKHGALTTPVIADDSDPQRRTST
nr:uncharacterized protein CTRU02_03173 [Colletotrichum truncatum]KAF6797142.1 hypothetical protein CTRU02_03173 [Colletotrichum truncatum]